MYCAVILSHGKFDEKFGFKIQVALNFTERLCSDQDLMKIISDEKNE